MKIDPYVIGLRGLRGIKSYNLRTVHQISIKFAKVVMATVLKNFNVFYFYFY